MFAPLLPPSASVTSAFDIPLATLFFSGGEFFTAGNLVTDGITFPEYRPFYGGVLGWSGTILVPSIVSSSLPIVSSSQGFLRDITRVGPR